MRGSIWTVAALAFCTAMLPALLDVDVSGDTTGQTAQSLLTLLPPVMGLLVFVAGVALLIGFLSGDGF
jgi:hypothetical protein